MGDGSSLGDWASALGHTQLVCLGSRTVGARLLSDLGPDDHTVVEQLEQRLLLPFFLTSDDDVPPDRSVYRHVSMLCEVATSVLLPYGQ